MTPLVKSISEKLDGKLYGSKAEWLSLLRAANIPVPDAIVFPGCTTEGFQQTRTDYLTREKTLPLLAPFCDTNGLYPVAIRSSSSVEDTLTQSMAGHFESYLGTFTLEEILDRICAVYQQGFSILVDYPCGRMAVIVQRLIMPQLAGVCFSANPLSSCRDELVVSFTQGLAADLVSGKVAGCEFTINRKDAETTSDSVPLAFPRNALSQLKKDVSALEQLYNLPLDIEWCLDQEGQLQYVQCRPIANLLSKQLGLLPVKKSFKQDFPSVVVNHDKVAIRLLCEQHGILISNAYLHTACGKLNVGEPNCIQLVTSPNCVSFSAVLVFPKRLDGNIVRHFAKNDATRQICSDRQCMRYSLRELSTQDDLESKLRQIHEAALSSHWLSVIIIQEIFEPVFTGITMQVDRGILIELAYGHFVPKGVVPTSYYLMSSDGQVLAKKEICQESAFYIENGEAVPRHIDKLVSVSPVVLAKIVRDFALLTKVKTRALEFGVYETREKELQPYLIDLVDVSPESSIACSLLGTGVLSQGVFTGRIVNVPKDFLNLQSLHEHLQSSQSSTRSEHEPFIYHATRPDIGLLRLVRYASHGRIAFVFDEGSFLSHFAIILREKQIPAIIDPQLTALEDGVMAKLDAQSENLSSAQRLSLIEQRFVLSYVNPDTDGIVSGLAFQHLKSFVGEDYQPVYFGVIASETKYVLQVSGLNTPKKLSLLDSGRTLALVDSHHLTQLPESILPERVCEIVDHHSGGNPELFVNAKIRNEQVGAVCTLLAEDLFSLGIDPPVGLAKAMALAIVSNTLNFSAPSTTARDQSAFMKLCELGPVGSDEISAMFYARSDFSAQSLSTVLKDNSKKYCFSGKSVLLVQIEAVEVGASFDNRLTEDAIMHLKEEEGALYAAVSLVDPIKKKTIIRAADRNSSEVLSRVLQLEFINNRTEVERILLRKTDFVPQLEAYLLSLDTSTSKP